MLHLIFVMMDRSPGLCALPSATVVTPLLHASVVSQGVGVFQMRWLGNRRAHLANRRCGENMQMGQAAEVIWYLWDEWNSPLSFPHFPSHFCVTRLVKSLSLKLPRSMGHRSEKPSNRRKSEREREGERVREIGPGMIANCLSNGCHPGSHFRWLVIRHERGRPARIPLLPLLLSGPPYLRASGYHWWPHLLKLLSLQFWMPFLFSLSAAFSVSLSLSHFASSSLQCVSLAPAQQLLFSDRSVKQKMMLGKKIDLEAKHSLPILTTYCSALAARL